MKKNIVSGNRRLKKKKEEIYNEELIEKFRTPQKIQPKERKLNGQAQEKNGEDRGRISEVKQ